MRILLIIFFVLACMAITIRVDGVWPPPAFHQGLDRAVQKVAGPTRALIRTGQSLFTDDGEPGGARLFELSVCRSAPPAQAPESASWVG